jgi:uncharacterized protein YbjT (DUF2867 family)
MKALVMGSTGGSGRAAVDELLRAGHEVTAFARRADAFDGATRKPSVFVGDATDPVAVRRAVAGHDAVVVTLGIHENAMRVRLFGSARTPLDIRSRGTRNVISAMRAHGVRRLVVQTTYGVGATRGRLPFGWKMMFALVLGPQIADTEAQEREVRASGLDWVLVQPVALTDELEEGPAFASVTGEAPSMKVSRRRVGRFLAEAATDPRYVGVSVALSSSPERAARTARPEPRLSA